MKTADEILSNTVCFYWSEHKDTRCMLIEAMQVYAKQVAKQTLKDAVHAHLGIWDFKDEHVYYSAKESILNNPIVTP